jgi:nucleoside-diphosphate-sugar epimerase
VTTLLLSGATGFLGQALTRAGRARGLDVVPLPRDLAGVALHAGDVVINAAGRVSGSDEELLGANVQLPARLGELCRAAGAQLLHVGSAAEYGEPLGQLVREGDPAAPRSAYGRSRLEGTLALQGLSEHGLTVTVARVFNVVGGYDTRDDPVSEFAAVLRSGATQVPVRDPSLVRDFAGVGWVADRLLDLASHVGRTPVVNVCTGRGTSFGEMVAAMAQVLGRAVEVVAAEPEGLSRVVGDPALLRELLGDAAEPEALEDVARWALTPTAELTSAGRG